MNLRHKHRHGSVVPRTGIVLSLEHEFEHDEWVEHMSERAARAAAWRRKQRKKRREHWDRSQDH
jgi:hypothetical protein